MRTGDTQSVPTNTPDIYVEIQTPTPEDVSALVVKFHFDEQIYGGLWEIWLDNADSALAAKSYEGYRIDLELGFSGGTRTQFPDLWVDTQHIESVEGKLTLKLTCIDAWGLLARVNTNVGAQFWNYPELAAGLSDANATYDSETIQTIVAAIILVALDNTFGVTLIDGGLDDDGYFDTLKPPIRITNAREGVAQLMAMTDSYLLYKNDGNFHVIKPSAHPSVYTFTLGSNHFWEDSESSAILIPNRFVYHGRNSSGTDIDSGTTGRDATSFSRIGIDIVERYYANKLEIELISDQTLLDNLAAATLLKKQGEASLGTLFAPIHCSLELFDKITISDSRYSGTKTITGFVHRIIRDYEANEGIYSIAVQLGGIASAYTPPRGKVPIAKVDDPEPAPLRIPANLTNPVLLPAVIDIDFTAVDDDDISWGATDNTITYADGTTQTIDAGSLNLANGNPYYLYAVIGNTTLQNTQTFGDAIGSDRTLVAFAKKAATTDDKALIVVGTSGQDLFIDELSAISANMGILTAGEIRVGTGTLGSDFTGWRMWVDTNVGRMAGYSSDTIQWYSDTDGKLYAGAGKVRMDTDGITLEAGVLNFWDNFSTGSLIGGILAALSQLLVGAVSGATLTLQGDNGTSVINLKTGIAIDAGGGGITPTDDDLDLYAKADARLWALNGVSIKAGSAPTAPTVDDLRLEADDELHINATDRMGIGVGATPSPAAGNIVITPSGKLLLTRMESTLVDVTSSRVLGTTYQNTSTQPRLVTVSVSIQPLGYVYFYCDAASTPTTIVAINANETGNADLIVTSMTILVPVSYYYKVVPDAGTVTLSRWAESPIG